MVPSVSCSVITNVTWIIPELELKRRTTISRLDDVPWEVDPRYPNEI